MSPIGSGSGKEIEPRLLVTFIDNVMRLPHEFAGTAYEKVLETAEPSGIVPYTAELAPGMSAVTALAVWPVMLVSETVIDKVSPGSYIPSLSPCESETAKVGNCRRLGLLNDSVTLVVPPPEKPPVF